MYTRYPGGTKQKFALDICPLAKQEEVSALLEIHDFKSSNREGITEFYIDDGMKYFQQDV